MQANDPGLIRDVAKNWVENQKQFDTRVAVELAVVADVQQNAELRLAELASKYSPTGPRVLHEYTVDAVSSLLGTEEMGLKRELLTNMQLVEELDAALLEKLK